MSDPRVGSDRDLGYMAGDHWPENWPRPGVLEKRLVGF